MYYGYQTLVIIYIINKRILYKSVYLLSKLLHNYNYAYINAYLKLRVSCYLNCILDTSYLIFFFHYRMLYGVQGILAIVMIISSFFIYETPNSLIERE